MSIIETVADIVVSKIVVSILCLPVMSVVDNSVSKTMIISLVSIIMSKSMINTTIDIMRSKSMSWLTIKAVLCKWSAVMVSKSIIICLGFFVICLCILKFSSKSGLIFMWSHLMMSVWLIGINLLVMREFVMRAEFVISIVSLDMVRCSICVVGWGESMMSISMSVERVVWCLV